MTYARARLWLGISGVGSLVTLSALALFFNVPTSLLNESQQFRWTDIGQFFAVIIAVNLWMIPFDFLGGYRLPRKFEKSADSFAQWLTQYLLAVIGQSTLFVIFAALTLTAGRAFGVLGAVLAISVGVFVCLTIRKQFMYARQISADLTLEKFVDALEMAQSWETSIPETMVVKHRDVGFTGGIVGFGKNASIVVPQGWLQTMKKEHLATAVARRAVAISSGGYTRGLIIAFLWNVIGFVLCSSLPYAGLTSVATLVTTFCWFTLWSFLGLLVLPTVSRNASLQIDHQLVQQGVPTDLIFETANSLDQKQDGEPDRPKLIETIFHPVPNVSSRNQNAPKSNLTAWNLARTTLFLSWPFFGVLSRAVHCNVGRPELWMMLPTD